MDIDSDKTIEDYSHYQKQLFTYR